MVGPLAYFALGPQTRDDLALWTHSWFMETPLHAVSVLSILALASNAAWAQRINSPTLDAAWSSPAETADLRDRLKSRPGKPGRPACPAAVAAAADPEGPADCDAAFSRPWGIGVSDKLPASPRAAAAAGPLNTGFQALGPAGKTGKVDGPGSQGNGTYKVHKNEPYELGLNIATGYISGTLTLKRDAATGADTIRFAGWLWDHGRGAWGAFTDTTNDVRITYNARKDEGRLNWTENGEAKSEGFWGGRAGRRSMTIEAGGGWNHDFKQD